MVPNVYSPSAEFICFRLIIRYKSFSNDKANYYYPWAEGEMQLKPDLKIYGLLVQSTDLLTKRAHKKRLWRGLTERDRTDFLRGAVVKWLEQLGYGVESRRIA